jgi:hypothetical protein
MPSSNLSSHEDVEKGTAAVNYAHLTNTTVHGYSWENVTVTVKDRSTKESIDLLSDVSGLVEAGMLSLAPNPALILLGG